jgi:tetratricopeptide (TPR) repeat protein
MEGRLGWGSSNEEALRKGVEAAERALAINDNEPDAWSLLGALRLYQRRYDEALEHGKRSIDLAPNAADLLAAYALTLNFSGEPHAALGMIEQAMRLSPYYPDWYLGAQGIALRLLGKLDEAIAADHKRLERSPRNEFSDLRLAAVYAQRGDIRLAQQHMAEALNKNPRYSAKQVRVTDPYRDDVEMERYLDLLRTAGLPE